MAGGSRYDPENLYAAPDAAPASGGSRYDPQNLYPAPQEPPTSWTWADLARLAPAAFGALNRSIPQTADDVVRATANAATFGMADRFAGAMNRATGLTEAPDYSSAVNEEVKRSEAARERNPPAGIAGDVAGVTAQTLAAPALGGAGLVARLGAGPLGRTVAAPLVGGATREAGPLARAVGYGTVGATVGALQGAGGTYSENLPDYVKNAVMGGVLGGVTGATSGAAFGPRPAMPRRLSAAELEASKTAKYNALSRNEAEYHPTAIHDLADTAEQRLYNQDFGPDYSKKTWEALDMMRAVPHDSTVTPANLDYIRKQLNQIPYTEATRTDRRSGGMLKDMIDQFMVSPPPQMVKPGTEAAAAEASRLAEGARGDYAAMRRVQKMEAMRTAAEDAGTTPANLVKNFINPNTQGFAKRTRGFTPEEIDMLRNDIARSGRGPLATLGNFMGGGGGKGNIVAPAVLSAAGGVAGHYLNQDPVLGGAVGFGIPVAGMALRHVANQATNAAMERAIARISQRSPLYRDTAAAAMLMPTGTPTAPNAARARDAVTFELLRQYQQPEEAQ